IGAGGIAGAHVRGYQAAADAITVAAVSDVVAENARRRAGELGDAATYSDYREMLEKTPVDAVDICLPHHLHVDAIVAAAEAGKHVLCEKPLCLSLDEAARVGDAVDKAGITLMCAHNQLFMPPVAKARELLTAGAIGTPYELRTTDSFFNNFDPANMGWRAHKATSGGGELIDTGYHPTYLLLHLAGSAPTEVTAMTSTHRLAFMEGEDSAQVMVRFASGAVGTIITSWAYNPAGCTERFSVVGEKGSLWSDGTTLSVREGRGDTHTYTFDPVDGFTAEIADFARCIREGARPIDTQVEGINVLKVILGAYESVEKKAIVAL
ncbi:MAG: Gfo/Idh/MocA family protein, partial [Mycobacteriales bacterium]